MVLNLQLPEVIVFHCLRGWKCIFFFSFLLFVAVDDGNYHYQDIDWGRKYYCVNPVHPSGTLRSPPNHSTVLCHISAHFHYNYDPELIPHCLNEGFPPPHSYVFLPQSSVLQWPLLYYFNVSQDVFQLIPGKVNYHLCGMHSSILHYFSSMGLSESYDSHGQWQVCCHLYTGVLFINHVTHCLCSDGDRILYDGIHSFFVLDLCLASAPLLGPNIIRYFFCHMPQLIHLSCTGTFFVQVLLTILTMLFGITNALVSWLCFHIHLEFHIS